MIKFEIDKSKKGIEVLLDSEGIDELINYLNFIKDNNESIHLIAGNELSEENSQNKNDIIAHVKIIYVG
jgi:16S rRNA G527 N7-methylase RsmG